MDNGRDGTTGEVTGEEEVGVAAAATTILGATTRHHLTLARTTATSPGALEGAARDQETTHNRAGGRISGVPLEEQQREQQRVTVLGGWVGITTTLADMVTTGAHGAAEEGARRVPARQVRVTVPASAVLATKVQALARQVVARSFVYLKSVNRIHCIGTITMELNILKTET